MGSTFMCWCRLRCKFKSSGASSRLVRDDMSGSVHGGSSSGAISRSVTIRSVYTVPVQDHWRYVSVHGNNSSQWCQWQYVSVQVARSSSGANWRSVVKICQPACTRCQLVKSVSGASSRSLQSRYVSVHGASSGSVTICQCTRCQFKSVSGTSSRSLQSRYVSVHGASSRPVRDDMSVYTVPVQN